MTRFPSGKIRRVLGILLLGGCLCGAPAHAQSVAIEASPIPLDPMNPAFKQVGPLVYRGGLSLSAPVAKFGSFSTLRVTPDGKKLVTVSDSGHFLEASLRYDQNGELAGLTALRFLQLLDDKGETPAFKWQADAEAMEWYGDKGGMLVAFEMAHRLRRYSNPSSVPAPFPAPEGLDNAPDNEGVEAMVRLEDDRLVIFTEGLVAPGGSRGWVLDCNGGWEPLTLALDEGYLPSDASRLPNGDLIVLARKLKPIFVFSSRLIHVPKESIVPGEVVRGRVMAQLESPLAVDNFEGVDAREGPGGEVLIYLISDDNFTFLQRTLLLLFALDPADPAALP